jgi:hypothetical protein
MIYTNTLKRVGAEREGLGGQLERKQAERIMRKRVKVLDSS